VDGDRIVVAVGRHVWIPSLVGIGVGKVSPNGVKVQGYDLCCHVTLTSGVKVAPNPDRARRFG
jgi:hypothetical protein